MAAQSTFDLSASSRAALSCGACLLIFLLASCGAGTSPTVNAAHSLASTSAVSVWLTTPDQNNLVAPQTPVGWLGESGSARVIKIDDTKTYQQIDGFGANYSDLTTYLMTYHMSAAQRAKLLNRLFSAHDGAGFNVIRLAIGANDQVFDQRYNDRASTYADNDGTADYGLNSFSIRHDVAYILPRIRDAVGVNPGLKILATSWWQPSWLVVSDTTTCGKGNGRPYVTVDPRQYHTYANLFVKYVQAYAGEGVNIWAVQPQNEPNCDGGAQQNMVLSASGQNAFVRDYLYPALRSNGLSTAIMPDVDNHCYAKAYANTILSDAVTPSRILGISWHGYCANATEESIRAEFPATPHYMTEVDYGAPYDWRNLTGTWGGSIDVISELRNNAKAYLWHAMANSMDGNRSNCPARFCGSLIRIDEASGEVAYDMPFYVLEHFSRFARPGSVRIDSTEDGPIRDVAFKNPDGSIVLVAANTHSSKSQKISVQWHGGSYSYTLTPNSLATFTWSGE